MQLYWQHLRSELYDQLTSLESTLRSWCAVSLR